MAGSESFRHVAAGVDDYRTVLVPSTSFEDSCCTRIPTVRSSWQFFRERNRDNCRTIFTYRWMLSLGPSRSPLTPATWPRQHVGLHHGAPPCQPVRQSRDVAITPRRLHDIPTHGAPSYLVRGSYALNGTTYFPEMYPGILHGNQAGKLLVAY